MPTLGSSILPALDAIRAIGGKLGLRPFTVTARLRVWSGERPGVGAYTDTDTVLTNMAADGTKQPVMVKQVSRRDAIASGGLYTDRDLRVGPITPPFPAALGFLAGGFDDTTADPQPTNSATEVIWIVSSPTGTFGFPPGGVMPEGRRRGHGAALLRRAPLDGP